MANIRLVKKDKAKQKEYFRRRITRTEDDVKGVEVAHMILLIERYPKKAAEHLSRLHLQSV